jgi:nitrogen regulatory protein PII
LLCKGVRVVPQSGNIEFVKQIIAVIKPFLADKVLAELEQAPLEAIEVQSVRGYGRQKNYLDQYADTEYSRIFLPKIEIRMWVQDSRADEVVQSVTKIARTGRMGDGKIFVVPVVQYESIRNI